MTITTQTCLNISHLFALLREKPLPFKVRNAMRKMARQMEPHIKDYQEELQALSAEAGDERLPNGFPDFGDDDEARTAYFTALSELLAAEVKIQPYSISEQDLSDTTVSLTDAEFDALQFLTAEWQAEYEKARKEAKKEQEPEEAEPE